MAPSSQRVGTSGNPGRFDCWIGISRPEARSDLVGGFTYIPTGEGSLYLAMILDLFTRKVVGWAMREHVRSGLTIAAVTMAIQRRRPGPCLMHDPDRGSQMPPATTARSSRPPPSRNR